MKQPLFINIKKKLQCWSAAAVFFLFAAFPFMLSAQTDSTIRVADSAAQATELISPALEFIAVQKGDNTIELKIRLKGKVNGQAINFYKMKVSFFRVSGETSSEIGFVITDGSGKGVFTIKADSLKPDAEGKISFKAVFAGNKAMDAVEEVAAMKKAKLEITPLKEDSVLSVQVKLTDESTGTETPVREATVGIFVKRMFLPLKVGEGTTDENGEATIEFPNNLPGDINGNLEIIARLDENETYGNLEASSVQKWGTPVTDKIQVQQRALWSTHPPMWMLITFIILMTTVWGHYIVIVYELFRLRKEQPHTPTNATNS